MTTPFPGDGSSHHALFRLPIRNPTRLYYLRTTSRLRVKTILRRPFVKRNRRHHHVRPIKVFRNSTRPNRTIIRHTSIPQPTRHHRRPPSTFQISLPHNYFPLQYPTKHKRIRRASSNQGSRHVNRSLRGTRRMRRQSTVHLLQNNTRIRRRQARRIKNRHPSLRHVRRSRGTTYGNHVRCPRRQQSRTRRRVSQFNSKHRQHYSHRQRSNHDHTLPTLLFNDRSRHHHSTRVTRHFNRSNMRPSSIVNRKRTMKMFHRHSRVNPHMNRQARHRKATRHQRLRQRVSRVIRTNKSRRPFRRTVRGGTHVTQDYGPTHRNTSTLLRKQPSGTSHRPRHHYGDHSTRRQPPRAQVRLHSGPNRLHFTNTIGSLHDNGARRSTTNRANIRSLSTRSTHLAHNNGTNRTINLNRTTRSLRHHIINHRRSRVNRRNRRYNLLLFNTNTHDNSTRTRRSTRIISSHRRTIMRRPTHGTSQNPIRRQRRLTRQTTNRRHPRPRRRTHHHRVERQIRGHLQSSFRLLRRFLRLFILLSNVTCQPTRFVLQVGCAERHGGYRSYPGTGVAIGIYALYAKQIRVHPTRSG